MMTMLKSGTFVLLLSIFLVKPCTAVLSPNKGQYLSEPLRKVREWSSGIQSTAKAELFEKLQGVWNPSWPTVVKLRHESVVKYGYQESGNQFYNLSKPCVHDLLRFAYGVSEMEGWALQMLDASGKLSSGILLGNTLWVGTYSECIGVSSKQSQAQQEDNSTILGEYCLVKIGADAAASGPAIDLGVCVPRTCNSSDALAILNLVLGNFTDEFHAVGAECKDDRAIPLDSGAIVVITILCVIGTLLILGTCVDVLSKHMDLNGLQRNGHSEKGLLENGHTESANSDDCNDSPLINGEGTMRLNSFIAQKLNTNSCHYRFLTAFSVLANAKKIVSLEQPPQTNRNLDAVNGIRFISMTWIILEHTYLFALTPASNYLEYLDFFKRFSFQPLVNGAVAVDTFFLLSGTLASYLLLLELQARNGLRGISWAKFYFHRFWRLTPLYMIVLGIWATLYKYVGSGPFWPEVPENVFCKTNWWANVLYINNIVRPESMCMTWSWYLSNDMQFYVLLPIFVVLLYKWAPIGGIVTFIFMLTSSIAIGVMTYVHDYPAANPVALQNATDLMDYMKNIYFVPWCRINPYLVGILLGYILYKTNCKLRIHRALVVLGWCLAAVCSLSVLYGLYDVSNGHPLSPSVNALYASVHRTAWSVGVAWVILACATGNGGFVNRLLSLPIMQPLGRLTFSAYLVQEIVIFWYYQNLKEPVFANHITMTLLFLGYLVLAYAVAFVFFLLIEAPTMNLDRSFLRNR